MHRYILSKASIKLYFLLVPVTVISLMLSVQSCSDVSAKGKNVSPSSLIDGAWEVAWSRNNDTLQDMSKSHLFKMFHDGNFALIATVSSGKIDFVGYGTYELSGNSYKETFIYHNEPDFVGAMNWQDFQMQGDTLYFKGFKKVMVKGKEVTANFPKIEEKWVRVKKVAETNDGGVNALLEHIREE